MAGLEVVFFSVLLDKESEINFLMKLALVRVVILPYAYLLDKWRWKVAEGTISPENYTKSYWDLR